MGWVKIRVGVRIWGKVGWVELGLVGDVVRVGFWVRFWFSLG